jgi:16S rRNA processing protein RimM
LKSSSNDTIDVGYVLRAHGVRGIVRIKTAIDLSAHDALWLGDQRFAVRHASRDKDDWLVTLDGVGDRDAADALRGRTLRLSRADIPVAADELLVADLVGCKVYDVAGTALGEVTGSFDSGAHEVLEVRGAEGGGGAGKEFMLPFIDAFIVSVDTDGKRIVCDPPPGLIDLDEAE